MNPEEIERIAQNAVNGNWVPFSIVVFLIGVIIIMIVKQNDNKHGKTEKIMEKLADIQAGHEKMLERHEAEIKHLSKTP